MNCGEQTFYNVQECMLFAEPRKCSRASHLMTDFSQEVDVGVAFGHPHGRPDEDTLWPCSFVGDE